MQSQDFLHKNCIPIRQKFVRHHLQIRSVDEVKIFKYTCCAIKGRTKVFLWYSETALELMQNQDGALCVNN